MLLGLVYNSIAILVNISLLPISDWCGIMRFEFTNPTPGKHRQVSLQTHLSIFYRCFCIGWGGVGSEWEEG